MFKKFIGKLHKKNITENVQYKDKKRYYLNVPYKEKEVAKSYGARWHRERRRWYIEGEIVDNEEFCKWLNYEEDYSLFATRFYLAESVRRCWKCKKNNRVLGMLYDNYQNLMPDSYIIDSKEIEVNVWHDEYEPFFSPLSALTDETVQVLESINHPIAQECVNLAKKKNAQQYCEHCNSKQGNFYLFEEIDSPFSFMDLKLLNNISLYKVEHPVKSNAIPFFSSLENKRVFVRNATKETIT
ncbi:DUF5710 domain-containing protein [Anaerobacillus sp. 1_MG-2023]|uniref:DUF5710 domain-containing protein n=1 Tax=Anaerobacillus sp. 1_MG-2023 TaxID=3062655 RepID=UPI0026E4873B|nr:DUF5710 domain-containing protein [Anaerobacillus sp. 1_MG-2023]MDO6658108.1 DUF5710 domain-containing protein [Anaerobacillus sp. 1_MG-2023]